MSEIDETLKFAGIVRERVYALVEDWTYFWAGKTPYRIVADFKHEYPDGDEPAEFAATAINLEDHNPGSLAETFHLSPLEASFGAAAIKRTESALTDGSIKLEDVPLLGTPLKQLYRLKF